VRLDFNLSELQEERKYLNIDYVQTGNCNK